MALFTVDPRADFSLVLAYHNEPVEVISRMENRHPVLVEVPRTLVVLSQAAAYGLKAGSSIKASVKVQLTAADLAHPTVAPADVSVLEATIDGAEPPPQVRDRVYAFLTDQLRATRWMPAPERPGASLPADASPAPRRGEEIFEVWLVQARSDGVADRAR